MTAIELDPVFVRALRLLHSKNKDSTSQLRTMLDEAIRHRKGLGPGPTGAPPLISSTNLPMSPSMKKNIGNSGVENHSSRKEAEKRSLDRLKHELSELNNKRPRLDSPRSSSAGFSSKSHTPSPTPPGSRGEVNIENTKNPVQLNSSSDENDLDTGGGMSIDLELEGLNDCMCFVCKTFAQDSHNKLVECHTCQNLFHQECHNPVVGKEEANDPRLVWNCSECSKKIPSVKHLGKSSPSGSSSSSGSKGINVLKGTASPSKTDAYKNKDKSSGSGGKPSGMAALAASFKSGSSSGSSKSISSSRSSRSGSSSSSSSKHHSSSSSSSSSSRDKSSSSSNSGSSSSRSGGSSSDLSADRRIQMMKKKAAAAAAQRKK